MDDKSHLPLLRAVVCCTSVPPEQRTHLATCVEQMGAIHKYDLTSDVTHLVVGDIDTPKYKFVAKERPDVKCLLPSWIEAVRESWIAGGETDVQTLEEQHKLPTFYGLKICVTGFADPDERKDLEDRVTAHGGEYMPNLTKEETHLVAKEPSGAKYEFAERYGIKIIATQWLDESIERGMVLDPSLYHPLIPPEKRGLGAWIRKSTSTTVLGKHTREETQPERSRKLSRTASARLENANSGLWGDIVIQEVKIEPTETSAWDEDAPLVDQDQEKKPLIPYYDQKPGGPSQISAYTECTTRSVRRSDIFNSKIFILYGFDEKKTSVLETHLISRGAKIGDIKTLAWDLREYELSDSFVIVPHTMPTPEIPNISKGSSPLPVVTELWVERCLHMKQYQHPSMQIMSRPLANFHIAGAERLRICSTGFQGVDLLHMSKAVKLMGANYEEFFDPKASALLCGALHAGADKLRHARLWSKPAVKVEWLWDCLSSSTIMPFESYLIQPILLPAEIEVESQPVQVSEQPNKNKVAPSHSNLRSSSIAPSSKLLSTDEDQRNRRKGASSFKKQHATAVDPFPDDGGPQVLEDSEQKPSNAIDDHFPNTNSSSTHMKSLDSLPLQEITPNSSPPKPPPVPPEDDNPPKISSQRAIQPTASPSPSKPLSYHEDSNLGPAISSLLAHQRSHSAAHKSAPNSPHPRRRRQLLGRAPSNLSSGGTIPNAVKPLDFSRASSVDTLNTDGLGTPLSANGSFPPSRADKAGTGVGVSGVIYDTDHHEEEERKKQEEQLQMTQVGYQDPDALVWRDRVTRKMRGEKVVYGKTPRKGSVLRNVDGEGAWGGGGMMGARGKGRAMEKDESGGLGIAKRTRGAVGAMYVG
ncbi:uncharacterized protein KY384_004983 [Bacidia gigantensis]|uniref:uncharacterized protein n=1 Tax=Bacidia gigantensis TaxID=2732470 RepID=UPI001D04373B|nr:uncharacterized protein KY384_004983 [Bacidia gigantensis]KAG8530480.1 hypothetical protein KY384_004983 [Bacidia gigantensis]